MYDHFPIRFSHVCNTYVLKIDAGIVRQWFDRGTVFDFSGGCSHEQSKEDKKTTVRSGRK